MAAGPVRPEQHFLTPARWAVALPGIRVERVGAATGSRLMAVQGER
jgi:hypothetical protein